jgi:hypothetical protein
MAIALSSLLMTPKARFQSRPSTYAIRRRSGTVTSLRVLRIMSVSFNQRFILTFHLSSIEAVLGL